MPTQQAILRSTTIWLLAVATCVSIGCVNLDERKRPSRFGFGSSDAPTTMTKAPMKMTPEAMLKATKSTGASFVSKMQSVLPQTRAKNTIPNQMLADDDPTRLDNVPQDLGADLYIAAARLSEQSGRYEMALQQYNMALKTDGQNRNALIGMARLQHRLGKMDASIRIYRDALNIFQSDAVIMNDLGLCYARNGQLNEAISMLRTATQNAPDREMYRNNLAAALIEADRTSEALVNLTQQDGPATANYKIGYMLDRAGKRNESEPYLSQALAIDPNMTQARDLLNEIVPQISALPDTLAAGSQHEVPESQPLGVVPPRQLARPAGILEPATPPNTTPRHLLQPAERSGPFGFVPPSQDQAEHRVVAYVEDD